MHNNLTIVMKKLNLFALALAFMLACVHLTSCKNATTKVSGQGSAAGSPSATEVSPEILRGEWSVSDADDFVLSLTPDGAASVEIEFATAALIIKVVAEGSSPSDGISRIVYSQTMPYKYRLDDTKLHLEPMPVSVSVKELTLTESMQHSLEAENMTVEDMGQRIESKLITQLESRFKDEVWLVDKLEGKSMTLVTADGHVLQLVRK